MAHRQEEEQAARKKAGQGAVHKVTPEQLRGRQPRVDEATPEQLRGRQPRADELPSHTPQERPDSQEAKERNIPSPPSRESQRRTERGDEGRPK